MIKTKTLPAIRITDHAKSQIEQARKKFNASAIVELSQQDFRRLAYLFLSKQILEDKELPNIKLER